MILRIHLVHHYSSKLGNSQRSLLSPTGCVNTIPPIQQNPMQNGYDENKATVKAMRTSVRRTTASSQTAIGTTRTTSSSQCTTSTPMTTLTSTIAWCSSCVESAHSAHCSTLDDDTAHLMAQVLSPFIVIHGHTHGAFSLTRSLPSSFTFSSCPSPSSSSTPSCSLSSTARSSWQVCATPPQKRVRTP